MLSAVPVTVGIPLTHVGPGAAELGVFKVDTIGDCFIAATNLVHAQVTALALGSGTHEGVLRSGSDDMLSGSMLWYTAN